MHDKGLAAGDGSNLGTVLYNRGVYVASIVAEAHPRPRRRASGDGRDRRPPMLRDGI